MLARHARRYFEEGANDEIMRELRPCCCPQDMSLLRAQVRRRIHIHTVKEWRRRIHTHIISSH
jgi:hypothetical protein